MYDQTGKMGMVRMMGRFVLIRIVFALVIAEAVMILWNLLLPSLIHVTAITFWQALGLLALTRLLTGRGGGPGWRGRGHWHGKWQKMSDEERQNFRDEWRKKRF